MYRASLHRLRSALSCLAAAAGLTYCAPAHVTVDSVPEGIEVTQVLSSGKHVALGKTPLELNYDVATKKAGNNSLLLSLDSAAYDRENLLLPPGLPAGDHVITITMTPVITPVPLPPPPALKDVLKEQVKCPTITLPAQVACPAYPSNAFSQIATAVAEAQGDIFRKDYERAAAVLNSTLTQYDGVATLHVLLGNVYYLRRDVAHALRSYDRALALNPQDSQTALLVRRLRQQTGEGGAH